MKPLLIWVRPIRFAKYITLTISILFLSISVIAETDSAERHAHIIPIIDAGCNIGGLVNGEWMHRNETAKLLRGGETYRFYSFTKYCGEDVGSRPTEDDFFRTVEFPNATSYEECFFALGGKWNALLRTPKVQNPNEKIYRNDVAKYLSRIGLHSTKVIIQQVVRVDLEGDGKDEMLISASNVPEPPPNDIKKYKYPVFSIVLLRKLVDGRSRMFLLEKEIEYKPNEGLTTPTLCDIRAILDVDGDGTQEIVTICHHYEGNLIGISKVVGRKVKDVGGDGCTE